MKSKSTAAWLALFLGGVGAHKFYLGKNGWFYLLFCWTLIPAIIAVINAIGLFSMSNEAFDKQYNGTYGEIDRLKSELLKAKDAEIEALKNKNS